MFMKVWLNQYNVHLSIFHITETDNSKRNVSVNLSQRLQQFIIGEVSVESMELDRNFIHFHKRGEFETNQSYQMFVSVLFEMFEGTDLLDEIETHPTT